MDKNKVALLLLGLAVVVELIAIMIENQVAAAAGVLLLLGALWMGRPYRSGPP